MAWCLAVYVGLVHARCRDLGGNLIKAITEGAFQGLTLAAYRSTDDVTL